MKNKALADVAGYLFRIERKNCAEAVFGAWQKASGKDPEVTRNLSECGSGKAPRGLCGAVYAAQLVAHEDKNAGFTHRFTDAAGSLLCWEIRSMRKLSCSACVRLAAALLEENLQEVVV